MTSKCLKEARNVEMFVKETTRIHHVSFMLRMALEDFQLENYIAPKGSLLFLSPAALHMDPEVYPEPYEFNPLRFQDEKLEHSIHYLPFGRGMHKCLGMHFAITKLKIVFITLLLHFNIEIQRPEELQNVKTQYEKKVGTCPPLLQNNLVKITPKQKQQ